MTTTEASPELQERRRRFNWRFKAWLDWIEQTRQHVPEFEAIRGRAPDTWTDEETDALLRRFHGWKV